MCLDNPGCGCTDENVGNPVVIWPGYGVNPARNNGTDIEPVPIVPWRNRGWAYIQLQLSNGIGRLSFGKRLSYDSYLRMLYASNSNDSKGRKQVLNNQHPAGRIQPSIVQIQNAISKNAPQSSGNGGTGQVDPSILANRSFYG